MHLTIIRGLPGSGKSTEAKKRGVFHVEADMFCMKDGEYCFSNKSHKKNHSKCQKMIEFALSSGCDCVVSNTFTTLDEITPYLSMARKFGANVEVVRMNSNYGTIHNTPTGVIDRMRERFEDYIGEMTIN